MAAMYGLLINSRLGMAVLIEIIKVTGRTGMRMKPRLAQYPMACASCINAMSKHALTQTIWKLETMRKT